MKISYISGLSGAGKTRFIIKRTKQHLDDGERVIIAQPSTKLIDQTYNELRAEYGAIVERFHKFDGSGIAPVTNIMNAMRLDKPGPSVLIISHSAFDLIPFFHNANTWHLFIDEVPNSYAGHQGKISEVHDFFTKAVEVVEDDEKYSRLIPKDRYALTKIQKNQHGDAAYSQVQSVADKLLHKEWQTYVHSKQYGKFANASSKDRKFSAFSIRSSKGLCKFASCTMASALFENSYFHHFARSEGCSLVPYPGLPNVFENKRHDNGHLLSIYYLNVTRWSKSLTQSHQDVLHKFAACAKDIIGEADFVWQVNANGPRLFECGIQLTGSPHGINEYLGIDNAVIAAAYNPSVETIEFMKWRGISEKQVCEAQHFHAVYQAVMRISLRVADSATPKSVFVVDVRTAEWLHEMFPGSRMEMLGVEGVERLGRVGRPRKYANGAEKARAARDRAKGKCASNEVVLAPLTGIVSLHISKKSSDISIESYRGLDTMTFNDNSDDRSIGLKYVIASDTNTNDDTAVSSREITVTVFDRLYEPLGYRIGFSNFSEFAGEIHAIHGVRNEEKFDSNLFGPFVSKGSQTDGYGRQLDDIESLDMLVLDNDSGDLLPCNFAKLISNLRMVICNTFNSTPEAMRYRVIIPFSRSVSPEEYQQCFDAVMLQLELDGFGDGSEDSIFDRGHGFDLPKRTPATIFLAPTLADHPDGSFFEYFNSEERRFLDPDRTIKALSDLKPVQHELVTVHPSGRENIAPESEHDAVEKWKAAMAGEGGKEFFNLAVTLAHLGYGPSDLELRLFELALYGRSPEERKNQIPSIVKSLGRYGLFQKTA